MGNSYSIYRFSYHVFSDSTILPINCQKYIIQHSGEIQTNIRNKKQMGGKNKGLYNKQKQILHIYKQLIKIDQASLL